MAEYNEYNEHNNGAQFARHKNYGIPYGRLGTQPPQVYKAPWLYIWVKI